MINKPIRKVIPKKTRFEVFKRDKFKCQYCGKTPPDVILHVDHINPVSKGGTNNILNLITACFECNMGKKATLLSDDSVITKQKNQLDLLQDKREQIKMMMEWHNGLANIDQEKLKMISDYWEARAPGYAFSEAGLSTLKKLIGKYTVSEILIAIDTATSKYLVYEKDGETVTIESWQIAYSKLSGICSLNKASVDDPDLKEYYYMRGILRNRITYHHPTDTVQYLKNARSWGASIQELKDIVLTARSWSAFTLAIGEIINEYKKA